MDVVKSGQAKGVTYERMMMMMMMMISTSGYIKLNVWIIY
jgi:hypothetical protein